MSENPRTTENPKPTPTEPVAVEPTSAAPTPVESAPVEPLPVEPVTVESASAAATPVESAPVEPVTVESASAAAATPVESAPVAPTPAAPTLAAPAAVDPDPAVPDDPAVLVDPAPKRPRDPRRVVALVVSGVLAVAVLGAGAVTVVTVHNADRDPGAPVWSLPKAGKETKAAAATGLQGMLLPYKADTYGRGPDMAEFGSDVALTGAQATLLRKESIKDLPRSQRRELERRIDRDPVKGMAMRSYVSTDAALGAAYTMEIVLARMGNQRTVRSMAGAQKELFDVLKVFRKGPEIEGYKNSTACFLTPAAKDVKLDTMFCSGYVGDILVTATATAAKPLDKQSAADMLRAQLDRIKEPGAAV
ncbi:hypothetical protein [Streptomyces shenzhenensis]|uniref:hypothetical protein n=1 Tax=Streptomyces shenzhenensis TaxID=943815 RepID=UPI0015EFFCE8|nr:hypothetical protein [Streptomyces shenzhenensis]